MFLLEVALTCFQDIPESVRRLIYVKDTPDYVSAYFTFYRFSIPVEKQKVVEQALQRAGDTILSYRFSDKAISQR